MRVKVSVNLSKYKDIYDKKIINNINESLEVLEQSIDEKSPVDSWDYIKHNRKFKATKLWAKIIWSVYNDDPKAVNVEYWFRSSPVNWSKKDWKTMYTRTGARVYTRTIDEKENEIKKILSKI